MNLIKAGVTSLILILFYVIGSMRNGLTPFQTFSKKKKDKDQWKDWENYSLCEPIPEMPPYEWVRDPLKMSLFGNGKSLDQSIYLK